MTRLALTQLAPSLLALLVGGCSGTLWHGPVSKVDAEKIQGLPFFPPRPVVQQAATTTLVDAKGIVIADRVGSGSLKRCSPIITEQIITTRDYSAPQHVWYEPGFLETNKVSFTLNADGALLGTTVESTPDQGTTLKNLAGAATSFAALDAPSPNGQGRKANSDGDTGRPACNSGSVIVGARPFAIQSP